MDKKKHPFLLALVCLFLSTNLLANYPRLRVLNPQQTWNSRQGTIEEATLTIKPKGVYMEYGLYMTFAAKNTNFNPSEQLEAELFFDLPENAIVTDSWLWIGDSIMQAIILDKWTASTIYEGIVNRRRDPSILYKKSSTSYELRVYPMKTTMPRKVKITYLVPVNWTASYISSPLPTDILNTSATVPDLKVIVYPGAEWKNEGIFELPGLQFSTESASNNTRSTVIASDKIRQQQALSVRFDSPMRNGVYLSKFQEKEDEGYYQLALLPSEALDLQRPKKVCILVDYISGKSSVQATEVLNSVRNMLHANFSEEDYFNLIFSRLSIYKASENWVRADSTGIDSLFASLKDPVANYGNLPGLIGNGIDFVKDNGNDGSLLVISNSDKVNSNKEANQLHNDILELMDPDFPIHIADFANQNVSYSYVGNIRYYGNEYFYMNLSKATGGNYYEIRSLGNSFQNLMSGAFQSLDGNIAAFDLYTSLENGLCYGRQEILNYQALVHPNSPVLQVGKYKGVFPFEMSATGIYRHEFVSSDITIPDNDIHTSDETAKKIWTGSYIQKLESGMQNNQVIKEIVDLSLDNRILSLYTAFLALEPNDTIKFCSDCKDENDPGHVSVEETPLDSMEIKAFPNPFNEHTKIQVQLPETTDKEDVSLNVYDVAGRLVKTFYIETIENGQLMISWNGKDNNGEKLSKGFYIMVLSTPEAKRQLKLVLTE